MNKSDREIELKWPGKLRFSARGWPVYVILTRGALKQAIPCRS